MAAITKIPNRGKPWRVTISMPGIKEFSKSFITKKTAQAWAKKTESNLEAARIEGNSLARNLTLSMLIQELVNSRTLNQATVIALTWWSEHYGHELCMLIDKTIIREALKKLSEGQVLRGDGKGKSKVIGCGRTNATVNRYKASLSTAFEFGREHYDLPSNPCRDIKSLPEPSGRVRWLSDSEKKGLLKACKSSKWDRLYLLVTMAITTGARQVFTVQH